jgi:hypothetical protein
MSGGPLFLVEGQLVDHVEQRLLMHQLVLEHHPHDLMPRAWECRILESGPQSCPDLVTVGFDLVPRRPGVPRNVGIDTHRIDPPLEELLEKVV